MPPADQRQLVLVCQAGNDCEVVDGAAVLNGDGGILRVFELVTLAEEEAVFRAAEEDGIEERSLSNIWFASSRQVSNLSRDRLCPDEY